MCTARVVLVDDHPSFRRVARELLDLRGYAVVGEADCAAAAVDLAARLTPDCVLLDVRLGEESGFDVARALVAAHPEIAVLLVSADEELEGLPCVAACWARGFVAKRRLAQADPARRPRPLRAGDRRGARHRPRHGPHARRNAMDKLGARSRAHLVAKALGEGLVEL